MTFENWQYDSKLLHYIINLYVFVFQHWLDSNKRLGKQLKGKRLKS